MGVDENTSLARIGHSGMRLKGGWKMRKLAGLLVVGLLVAPASADFFSPGEPNGWDNTTPMTDVGGGVWEYTWTGFTDTSPPTTNFDILSQSGDWDSKVHPSGNQWVHQDGDGGNTLSLDTNTYADGWSPDTNRVGVAYESSTTWTAVGDWQDGTPDYDPPDDWNNADPDTSMDAQGGGIYKFESPPLEPGWYQYKAVDTGTWDAIGANSRNVNADNLWFEVTAENPIAEMWVNVYDGTVKVNAIPEPATLALLALGGLALLRRR
jgi:hypothetical protein